MVKFGVETWEEDVEETGAVSLYLIQIAVLDSMLYV